VASSVGNSDAASCKLFRISKGVFIKASRNLKVLFFTIRIKKMKTIVAYTESTDLIFKTFKKISSRDGDTVP
jgi:hypothetical protein